MDVTVECGSGSPEEQRTREELVDLFGRFDLSPWRFTDRVVIQQDAIPQSHPVLTLGTFNEGPFLLASYVHEQLHWFLVDRDDVVQRLYEAFLRPRYPSVPVGPPEGAQDEESTYLHLVVCWLEVDALRSLLGAERGTSTARRLAEHGPYRWVYRTVLEDFDELGDAYEGSGLLGRLPPSH